MPKGEDYTLVTVSFLRAFDFVRGERRGDNLDPQAGELPLDWQPPTELSDNWLSNRFHLAFDLDRSGGEFQTCIRELAATLFDDPVRFLLSYQRNCWERGGAPWNYLLDLIFKEVFDAYMVDEYGETVEGFLCEIVNRLPSSSTYAKSWIEKARVHLLVLKFLRDPCGFGEEDSLSDYMPVESHSSDDWRWCDGSLQRVAPKVGEVILALCIAFEYCPQYLEWIDQAATRVVRSLAPPMA